LGPPQYLWNAEATNLKFGVQIDYKEYYQKIKIMLNGRDLDHKMAVLVIKYFTCLKNAALDRLRVRLNVILLQLNIGIKFVAYMWRLYLDILLLFGLTLFCLFICDTSNLLYLQHF